MAADESLKLKKLAEKLCQKEACAIQYCLQSKGKSACVVFTVLSIANKYQESKCTSQKEDLLQCCAKLNEEILEHSTHCGSFVSKQKGKK